MDANAQLINQIGEGNLIITWISFFPNKRKNRVQTRHNTTDLTLYYSGKIGKYDDEDIDIIGAYIIDTFMNGSTNHYYRGVKISNHSEATQRFYFTKVKEIKEALKEEGSKNLVYYVFDQKTKTTYFTKIMPK